MKPIPLIAGLLILSGAALMAVNLMRFKAIPQKLSQLAVDENQKFWRLYQAHQFLMLFFLIGYLVVFWATFQEIEFVGFLFVGVIFFFGAVFVFLGILLQFKMLNAIQESYLKVVTVGGELDCEKSKLLATNRVLTNEIEERRRVETRLRESQEHLKAIWDSINAGIVLIDAESHRIIDANPQALSMIGATSERVRDNLCHRFICPAEQGCCPITDKAEKVDKSERTLLTASGLQIPILKTVTEIPVKGRKHLLETFIDITQMKMFELKLKEASVLSESANRAKSEFLANMSHELRTPLNHIIGFSEMLVDGHRGDLNKDQQKYLGNVLQSSRHLLSLVNDILDLSKVEAGKLELKPEAVRLKPLLQSSLVMVKEKAMKHGIELLLDTDGIPEQIVADERKLKQILYNLLSNAVKFTPDGGTVRVISRRLEADEGIETAVIDTGVGIKDEDLERIFNPFEQVDASYSRKFRGTGLGLSLTKRLVELHGGRIWAESDGEGKGTRFSFTLPLAVPPLPAA